MRQRAGRHSRRLRRSGWGALGTRILRHRRRRSPCARTGRGPLFQAAMDRTQHGMSPFHHRRAPLARVRGWLQGRDAQRHRVAPRGIAPLRGAPGRGGLSAGPRGDGDGPIRASCGEENETQTPPGAGMDRPARTSACYSCALTPAGAGMDQGTSLWVSRSTTQPRVIGDELPGTAPGVRTPGQDHNVARHPA